MKKIVFLIATCALLVFISSGAVWAQLDVTFGTTPTMDGSISAGEYADANSITFATSGGTCTVYFKHSGITLYVAFDVPNTDAGSAVQVFVDTDYDQATAPQTDDYRFTVLIDSSLGENQGTGTVWPGWGPSSCWTAACQVLAGTWSAEFAIPYRKLGIAPGTAKTIGISFWNAWTVSGDHFWPATAVWTDPSTWGSASSSDNWWAQAEGWYFKPGYVDYAPNGMPDFDQKRNGWDSPPGSGFNYYYCGPVAVANCLWWFDSKFESGNIPPPDTSDNYPLVTAWGLWDDHDTSNVRPFVQDLATRMKCNPSWGTYVDTMQMAIDSLLIEKGLDDELEETTYWKPDFYFIEKEIERSQDVILLVGYWNEYAPGQWERWGGHYVTCAGVNSDSLQIAISDPYYDNACGLGGPGRVGYGCLITHDTPHPGMPTRHDDAGNVSHDFYDVGLDSPSPGGTWWLIGYPPAKALDFFGMNVPKVYEKYQAKEPGPAKQIHTEVEYAVVICPKDTMYLKPGYEDYAPNGMPDFDQKQDQWDNPPGSGNWTFCGPTAIANCLWWFDSKYQWIINPASPQPPAVNDDFDLVTAYGASDDHDRSNVQPLIQDLAWYMDTDGRRTGVVAQGTDVFKMEAAIAEWQLDTGTDTIFYEHTRKAPDFYWIEEEIKRSEDVILLLGFWQNFGPQEWVRVGGHYVTCAGVYSDSLTIAFSDPYYDRAELGGPGHVGNGVLLAHPPAPHGPGIHNDAGNISHDFYRVTDDSLSPGGPWSLPDYPPVDTIFADLQGANCPPEFEDQQGTYTPGYPVHTEIEYAVAISPIPDCWSFKGEYPDYAPDGMPDFDQNQHAWSAYCGPTAVANCFWWFDSKYQYLAVGGNPPPPFVQDDFNLVTSYIAGNDDHDWALDGMGYDNVEYLIEDLATYLGTDLITGTKPADMQQGIRQWLVNRGLDDVFYEHTFIDSTLDPNFFSIIEEEIECCQDVILLLGFWQEWAPGDWRRVGGHYVTCAGVCSDRLEIMFSDPDYDQHPIVYPPSPKWHNNAALVSHDVYTVAPNSPSPGGHWYIPGYPEEVGFRHEFENCPAHLTGYQEYPETGIPIHTEIEAAIMVSPFVKPEAVDTLWIYPDGGPTDVNDIRLVWTPVTEDTAGCPAYPYYAVYRSTVHDFTPGAGNLLTTTSATEWEDVGAAGNILVNYFYIVRARAGAFESDNSRYVGEFDQDLRNSSK